MPTATDLPAAVAAELDRPFDLTQDQITRFREDGFVKLSGFWSPELLSFFDPIVTEKTLEWDPRKDESLEQKDTYGKAFIQVSNMWPRDETIARLAMSKRAGQVAAELMGSDGVRMWHDQALYKQAGGGFTPWHVDQYYWPMDTGKSCTMWMPFHAVPEERGPLAFGKSSHVRHIARDIAISDESERLIREEIKKHKINEVFEPFAEGDVTFHYGWTLHRAGPNTTAEPRRVFTVIYMDQDMKLVEPRNDNHRSDWNSWTPSTKVGEVMDDELNPVIYSSQGD